MNKDLANKVRKLSESIRGLSASLARLYAATDLIEHVHPSIVANDPEFMNEIQKVMSGLNNMTLMLISRLEKIQESELSLEE